MIVKENINHSNIIINNAKIERFRKKQKKQLLLLLKLKKKKVKTFKKQLKNLKTMKKYKFNHPLIERHFLFKALQEVNEQLTKNNEGFLIDFSSRFHEFFKQQLMFYQRMEGYINEDEILAINLAGKDFYYLDQVIKQNTDDKEFIPWVEKLETNLLVIYIDVC